MNFLKANWENIIMANYSVPEDVLKAYLPKGTSLDLCNGRAYVSLVGFMFKKTKLFKIQIPWFGNFEEINLRFYVTRKEGNEIKRGVVFINETIPYKIVAWVANKLYKEHYTVVPTASAISVNDNLKQIEYSWQSNKFWNRIYVKASANKKPIIAGSFEEFIFEHYYGYTKIDSNITEEYKINHPRWEINEIIDLNINCNFDKMYGKEFSFLNTVKPDSVFLAEGSSVTIKWKRQRLKLNEE